MIRAGGPETYLPTKDTSKIHLYAELYSQRKLSEKMASIFFTCTSKAVRWNPVGRRSNQIRTSAP